MQQAISSYAPKPFLIPVAFNCTVYNNALSAEIVEEIDNPIDYTFVIKFSDGVKVEATSSENGRWWITDKRKLEYVNAIGDDLHNFMSVKNNEWDKFEVIYNGQTLLIWVEKTDEDGYEAFAVYFKGKYHFHLRKSKQCWEAKSVSVANPTIDEGLASVISTRLEALLQE